ncbi:MAG: hemerythrin domain-containing protein [Ornithinibacter sp.]
MPVGDGGASGSGSGGAARVVALGAELRRLHDRIRDVLDDAREGLDLTVATASLTDDLVLRCRAVCTTLGMHHRDEDAALFPWLRRAFPGLDPVVDRLEEDHVMIGALLSDLEHLVGSGADGDLVLQHLEGVDAIMENHFRYEERELVALLDSSGGAGLVLPERFWRGG